MSFGFSNSQKIHEILYFLPFFVISHKILIFGKFEQKSLSKILQSKMKYGKIVELDMR